MSTATYVFSIVKAVPQPRRDESINVGVVVMASDGTFSDVRLSSLDRVRRIDPDADIKSIEMFLTGVVASLPLAGSQSKLSTGGRATVDTLRQWSREFGGAVRLSEPRVAIGDDGARVLSRLYADYVGPVVTRAREDKDRIVMRPQILAAADRAAAEWNIAPTSVLVNKEVHGHTARHVVDRVYVGPRKAVLALAHAISFQAKDIAEIYANRATIIVAAEDIHEMQETRGTSVFAIHTDAPAERAGAMEESAELFRERHVIPVLYTDLERIRSAVDARLVRA